uniref:Modulator of smoothened n=1 Tax=Poecilia formosa TaxID=48698 RepID=A0A096LS55_POEFO
MDKLTIISGCLFLAADIFAIASIANPDWINTGESTGALTVGLVRQCQTIHGRERTCIPPRLPPEWVTTLFFIIMGIISLTVTCGLLVASHWRREATKYARWIAFTGMILFCMAALIFPIGFYINEEKFASQAEDSPTLASGLTPEALKVLRDFQNYRLKIKKTTNFCPQNPRRGRRRLRFKGPAAPRRTT